ncbi:MAG: arginine decarboxylase [Peptococcaceae bacterium]|nr:arginine decarboxylase [Peptococcaceae bacterium]
MKIAPLLEKIKKHIEQSYTGFHTPGHQQGKGIYTGFKELAKDICKMDLTELPGLDNLKNPTGCIKAAQELAAELFGSEQTFFLVNGSTVGLQAALLTLTPGKRVIVPRNAHISVVNGLVLSGSVPLVAPVVSDAEWGIPLGMEYESITRFLAEYPDVEAVVSVQPTYEGFGCNIYGWADFLRKKEVLSIVDEAHGAHLYFQDDLPLSAQRAKADVVIQSTHKTLGALTQASMLHVNNSKLAAGVAAALNILQTTSPSYLLMASLDSVQAQMSQEGRTLVKRTWEMALELRATLRKLPGFRLIDEEVDPIWYHDPTKILLSSRELGLTGWELARILQEDYGIVVELASYYYVLFLLTIGHEPQDTRKIVTALKEIAHRYGKTQALTPWEHPGKILAGEIALQLTPRQVYWASKEDLPLRKALGRIAAVPLAVYPPGIPLIWPGQVISKDLLSYLEWVIKNKFPVQGLTADYKIPVVREEGPREEKRKGIR